MPAARPVVRRNRPNREASNAPPDFHSPYAAMLIQRTKKGESPSRTSPRNTSTEPEPFYVGPVDTTSTQYNPGSDPYLDAFRNRKKEFDAMREKQRKQEAEEKAAEAEREKQHRKEVQLKLQQELLSRNIHVPAAPANTLTPRPPQNNTKKHAPPAKQPTAPRAAAGKGSAAPAKETGRRTSNDNKTSLLAYHTAPEKAELVEVAQVVVAADTNDVVVGKHHESAWNARNTWRHLRNDHVEGTKPVDDYNESYVAPPVTSRRLSNSQSDTKHSPPRATTGSCMVALEPVGTLQPAAPTEPPRAHEPKPVRRISNPTANNKGRNKRGPSAFKIQPLHVPQTVSHATAQEVGAPRVPSAEVHVAALETMATPSDTMLTTMMSSDMTSAAQQQAQFDQTIASISNPAATRHASVVHLVDMLEEKQRVADDARKRARMLFMAKKGGH